MTTQFILPEAFAPSVRQWLTCLALTTALASVGLAQQPAQNTPVPPSQNAAPATQPATPATAAPTDIGAPTYKYGVNEVSLIFTVNDKHGHYIANLNQNDFALLDDQKAPAKVNSF